MNKADKRPKITGNISFVDPSGLPLNDASMEQLSENLIMAILKAAEPEEEEWYTVSEA